MGARRWAARRHHYHSGDSLWSLAAGAEDYASAGSAIATGHLPASDSGGREDRTARYSGFRRTSSRDAAAFRPCRDFRRTASVVASVSIQRLTEYLAMVVAVDGNRLEHGVPCHMGMGPFARSARGRCRRVRLFPGGIGGWILAGGAGRVVLSHDRFFRFLAGQHDKWRCLLAPLDIVGGRSCRAEAKRRVDRRPDRCDCIGIGEWK